MVGPGSPALSVPVWAPPVPAWSGLVGVLGAVVLGGGPGLMGDGPIPLHTCRERHFSVDASTGFLPSGGLAVGWEVCEHPCWVLPGLGPKLVQASGEAALRFTEANVPESLRLKFPHLQTRGHRGAWVQLPVLSRHTASAQEWLAMSVCQDLSLP